MSLLLPPSHITEVSLPTCTVRPVSLANSTRVGVRQLRLRCSGCSCMAMALLEAAAPAVSPRWSA
jgi:hypothetical protein